MKREMLKEMGLSDDQIDKIMKVNGEDIEGVKANVTAKEAEVELLKNQLTEANKTIDGFKKLDVEGIYPLILHNYLLKINWSLLISIFTLI